MRQYPILCNSAILQQLAELLIVISLWPKTDESWYSTVNNSIVLHTVSQLEICDIDHILKSQNTPRCFTWCVTYCGYLVERWLELSITVDVCSPCPHRPVKLPWIFPRAPLTFRGALGNIQGNLDRYALTICNLIYPSLLCFSTLWDNFAQLGNVITQCNEFVKDNPGIGFHDFDQPR